MTRAFLLLLLLGAGAAVAPAHAQSPSPRETVERFLDAYNRHDVEEMLALANPEVAWLSIAGDSVAPESLGAEALGAAVRGHLVTLPSARSTVEGILPAGRFVSVWERAHWESGGKERSQASLSVYEVEDGKIRRIWYYPAEP